MVRVPRTRFTDYLSKVSPEWKDKVGSANSVKWPVEGLGGKGNEGVAANVTQTMARLVTSNSRLPSRRAGVWLGAKQSGRVRGRNPQSRASRDGRLWHSTRRPNLHSRLRTHLAKTAWPIATYHLLACVYGSNRLRQGQDRYHFVKWALTDPNAEKSAAFIDYIPLPYAVKTQVVNKLNQVTCNGKAF